MIESHMAKIPKVDLHTTTVLVVGGCSLLSFVLILKDKEAKYVLMQTTTITTLTCPTAIQGVVGSSCDGCRTNLLLYVVCNYYMAST